MTEQRIDVCLTDTNILLRLSRRDDPLYRIVNRAVRALRLRGTKLVYTHQNIAEFWNVATRPVERNGFGLTIAEADEEVRVIEEGMSLLADSAQVFREWRGLVVSLGVSGVQVHDARLAAAMRMHGVRHILTLNGEDFRRYPDIVVISPRELVGSW